MGSSCIAQGAQPGELDNLDGWNGREVEGDSRGQGYMYAYIYIYIYIHIYMNNNFKKRVL